MIHFTISRVLTTALIRHDQYDQARIHTSRLLLGASKGAGARVVSSVSPDRSFLCGHINDFAGLNRALES